MQVPGVGAVSPVEAGDVSSVLCVVLSTARRRLKPVTITLYLGDLDIPPTGYVRHLGPKTESAGGGLSRPASPGVSKVDVEVGHVRPAGVTRSLAVLATDLPDWEEGLWYSGGQADPALVGAVPALQPGQLHRQQVQPDLTDPRPELYNVEGTVRNIGTGGEAGGLEVSHHEV